MQIRTFVNCACAALLVFIASDSPAERSMPESVIGTWTLSAYASSMGPNDPLGIDPVGLLVYDDAGNVAAQVMRRDRNTLGTAGHDRDTATAGQRSTAVDGYAAYYGEYVVDRHARTITHRIKGSIAAADIGNSLVRRFRLDGDDLVLEFEAGTEFRRLHWKRVSGASQPAACAEPR
jgi:hypothetical protein